MKKIFILLTVSFLLSCNKKEMKIEKGDVVSTCVVDSVWVKQPISTLEFEYRYCYSTTCGNKGYTKGRQVYCIGDTILFVKKFKK